MNGHAGKVARHLRSRRVGPMRTSLILTGRRCPREYIATASSWPARVLGGKGCTRESGWGGVGDYGGHRPPSAIARVQVRYTMGPQERYMADCHTHVRDICGTLRGPFHTREGSHLGRIRDKRRTVKVIPPYDLLASPTRSYIHRERFDLGVTYGNGTFRKTVIA